MVATIFIARQLGPELAGRYSYLTWLVDFAVIITFFSLPNAMTRYIAELAGQRDDRACSALVVWTIKRCLGLALFGGISLYALCTQAFDIDSGMSVLLSLLFLLQAFSSLVSAYLSGLQDVQKNARISFLSGIILVTGQPILTLVLGLKGAVIGSALSCAIALAWLMPLTSGVFRRDSAAPKGLVDYAMHTWLAAILSTFVWSRAELFFLNSLANPAQVGYFSAGLFFVSLATLSVGLLTGALMPHFSTLVGGVNHTIIERDYRRMTRIVALIAFPISFGGSAVMPELIRLVFGDAFEAAQGPAEILMVGGVLAVSGVGSSLVYAFGRSAIIFKWGCLGAILVAVGCYMAVPDYGALGAAWIKLAVQTLMVALGMGFIHWRLGKRPPYKALALTALAAGVMGGVARAVLHYAPFFPLPLAITAGILVYVVMLRLLRPLPTEDVGALLAVTRYLPSLFRVKARSSIQWILRPT